jgi:hypothetical protein
MVAFVDRRTGAARVAERRAGHAFSAPRTLARPGGAVAAATDARGDRALAWWGRDGVFARVRRAGGGWGPVLRAARAQPTANGLIRAAITPAGRVVLAWQTADLRESQPLRLAAGAAVGSAGQAWRSFTLERSTLASASFSENASAIPLVDSAKRVYVIWTGVADGHLAVKLARIAASSPGPTVVLSGPVAGAAVDDAAAGPAGSLAVSWSVLRGAFSVTYASLRRGTGKFAAPERLTPEGTQGLGGSRVAFQPLTGEAIVTWGYVAADERGAVRASVSPAP